MPSTPYYHTQSHLHNPYSRAGKVEEAREVYKKLREIDKGKAKELLDIAITGGVNLRPNFSPGV